MIAYILPILLRIKEFASKILLIDLVCVVVCYSCIKGSVSRFITVVSSQLLGIFDIRRCCLCSIYIKMAMELLHKTFLTLSGLHDCPIIFWFAIPIVSHMRNLAASSHHFPLILIDVNNDRGLQKSINMVLHLVRFVPRFEYHFYHDTDCVTYKLGPRNTPTPLTS